MEGTTIEKAKSIFGKNFIGLEELELISEQLGICILKECKNYIPTILHSEEYLRTLKDEYILFLGMPYYKDKSSLNIIKMRDHLGIDPNLKEPCFYNQDWYLNEPFASECRISFKWYLIKKNIIESTRGCDIETQKIITKEELPSALICTFVFFAYYFFQLQYLWKDYFIWCADEDINGDRIYVARYFDNNMINKNGFNIHRHLKIKNNYGCLSMK